MPTSNDILGQIQANQATNKGAGDYLNEANTNLGVSGAQDTVKGLRTSIDNTTKLLEKVAPSVMGRTQNSLVTNAQATKQISNEQAPISKNLAELGGQYAEAGTNLSNLRGQASQQAQLGYQSQQDKQSYLQNLYNTMYGQEQNAAQAARQVAQDAEQRRQYESTQAENARQFNISQARAQEKASETTPAQAKLDATTGLRQDILNNVQDLATNIQNKPEGWTEKVLIPQLIKAYPEFSTQEIIDSVYQLRAPYESA